jgi:hypothetical protein
METIDKGKILKDNWNKIAKLTRLRKLTSKQKFKSKSLSNN